MNQKLAKWLRRMTKDVITMRDELQTSDTRRVYRRLKKDTKVHAVARELQRQMRLAKREGL